MNAKKYLHHGLTYDGAMFVCCNSKGNSEPYMQRLDCKIHAHIDCYRCRSCTREFHRYTTGMKGTYEPTPLMRKK